MTRLEATFKHEDEAEGEPVGPLILSDQDDAEFHEELGWMSLADAKKLAELNGWPLSED
jgi:hypothetical protein